MREQHVSMLTCCSESTPIPQSEAMWLCRSEDKKEASAVGALHPVQRLRCPYYTKVLFNVNDLAVFSNQ